MSESSIQITAHDSIMCENHIYKRTRHFQLLDYIKLRY